MRAKFKILFMVATLMMVLSTNVFAENVTVTLPTFAVRVNGVKIDNESREYPLIVYKDITYFPMTFYDSRFLGLETKWDPSTGLKVNRTETRQGYVDYAASANKSKYIAEIPSFHIEVNGKTIDNSKEQYPLIVFRGVTYFPLTWRFAVDEFGWDYKFTKEKGLEIKSQTNIDLEVTEVKLSVAGRREFHNGAFTVAGDYIYFEGEGGIIYQTPVKDLNIKKAVYELPIWSYGDDYVYPSLKTEEGKAMLSYHQGGAVMGTDYKIILNDDGTHENFAVGYLNRKILEDITVEVIHFPPPFPANLSMKKEGEEEFKNIGSADYIYGWVKREGQSPSYDLYRLEDDLYLVAYDFTDENAATGIYRVNIDTNETVRICDEAVQRFILEENMIYFMDLEGYLYKIPLIDGSKAERITDFAVRDFTVLEGLIYYVTEEELGRELYRLGEDGSLNPGGPVRQLLNNEGYVYCIFEDNAPYKLMVFNKEGLEVFKTNADIRFMSINQNRLFYHK